MSGRSSSQPDDARKKLPDKAALPLHAPGRIVARAVFTALLVLLALWMASDFLAPLAWAAVIAVALWPVYRPFAALISDRRSPVLAPLLFTSITGLVLLGPIVLAGYQAAQASETIVQLVTQLQENGVPVPNWFAQVPLIGEHAVRWWNANLSEPKAAGEWISSMNVNSITEWTGAFGGQLLHRLFLFFVTLAALFFLLRDGAWMSERVLLTFDRLLGDPGERLASKIVEAVRGTVNGTVVVAVVEGTLIGIGYVLAGVPKPFLFALLTIAFAMLPLGAWVAFTAAALLLLVQGGSIWAAAGVFGFGAAVMIIGDSFIWPRLVGGAARLPFLLALIGIFGGLQAFGLIGLLAGPVIMAVLLTVWREWLIQRKA
jgi:predicted PurR-regulated permease PerM